MRLDGKVAIITGGNSGIGKATALLFAKEGAKVVITARREKQLQKVSEEILTMGGNVLAVASDISNPAECTKVVNETLEKFGKLDILVNNAGILDHGTAAIDSVKDEDINAKGTIYFTREVAKVMAEQKSGAIVNTASVAGVVGNGGAAYVASKGAVIALTKNVALRMASIGVRCNAVCPGTVNTPMTSSDNLKNLDMNMLGAIMAHMDKNVPICQPEDVANTILFLASDEAKAITGQIIVTDFGATL